MRTTLYVDRQLLDEAMRVAEASTKTEVVNVALAEFVRRRKLEKLAARLGTLDLDLSPEQLVDLRKR